MSWTTVILHWLGVEPRSPSTAYNFWSGFGSDVGEVTLIGAVIATARHKNCHVHRCWRLGRHPVADGLYRVCARHHPGLDGQVTADTINHAHRAHRERLGHGNPDGPDA